MDTMAGGEYCRKCGMETYSFSRKYSISTGEYFCVKCAEKVDREYLIKNSCAMCHRILKSDELKVAVPSRIFGDTALILSDRILCAPCHRKFGNQTRDKMTSNGKLSRIRMGIRKSIARKMMQHRPQPQKVNAN